VRRLRRMVIDRFIRANCGGRAFTRDTREAAVRGCSLGSQSHRAQVEARSRRLSKGKRFDDLPQLCTADAKFKMEGGRRHRYH